MKVIPLECHLTFEIEGFESGPQPVKITGYFQELIKVGGRTDLVNDKEGIVPFHEAIRRRDPDLLEVSPL